MENINTNTSETLKSLMTETVKDTVSTPAPVITPPAPPEKRGRGRPKGSKNRPKPFTVDGQAPIVKVVRPRGRPVGSKNRPKVVVSDPAAPVAVDPVAEVSPSVVV